MNCDTQDKQNKKTKSCFVRANIMYKLCVLYLGSTRGKTQVSNPKFFLGVIFTTMLLVFFLGDTREKK